MDTDRGLQEVVSRNVRVLMAVHSINHQKDLAARLNWGADKLARTLNGTRRWALDDLPAVASVFGVRPAALLSDTAELVGAAAPAQAAGSDRVSPHYRRTTRALGLPHLDARRHLHLVQTSRHNIGTSSAPVTPVTTAVGM